MNKSILKVTVFAILSAALIGGALYLIFPPSYTLAGTVKDAFDGNPLANVSLTVGGKELKTDSDGKFSQNNVDKDIEVKVALQERYDDLSPIKVNFGSILFSEAKNIDVLLVPNITATFARINELEKNGDYKTSFTYMHPDHQKYWVSSEEYSSTFLKVDTIFKKINLTPTSYKLGDAVKNLDKWTDPVTGNEYIGVTELSFDATLLNGSVINTSMRWLKIDNVWHYFTNTSKEDVQKVLDLAAQAGL